MINAEVVDCFRVLKDDIVFGVIKRAEHEIMTAALRGNVGCIFEYPREYDDYVEITIFYKSLKEAGYVVVGEKSVDPRVKRIGIYWAQ